MAKVLLGVGRIGQSLTLPGFTQFGGAPTTANFTAEAMAARNFRVAGTFSDFAVKVDANGTSRHVVVRKNSADSVLDINPTDSTGGTFTDADTLAVTATDTINLGLTVSGTAFQLYWARLLFEASSGHVSMLASSNSGAASSPLFMHFAAGTTNATEANTKLKMRGGGTLSYGFVLVAFSGSGATMTVKLRKNGADGNTVITVTASTTGVFEDTSNTDTFTDGDDLNWSLTGQTSTPFVTCGGVISWSKPQNDIFSYIFTFNGSASDQFLPIVGAHPAQTTESNTEIPHGFAVRVHHARVQIYINSLGATETFRIRKNAADGNGTFTVASSTTGQFEDTTNTDLFSASDTISWKATGATTGSANFVLGVSHSPTQTLTPSLFANTNTFIKPAITWLTWDPVNKGTGISLSSLNRVAQSGDNTGNATARAVQGKTSGKWYWEIKADFSSALAANPLGLIGSGTSLNNMLGSAGNGARTSTAGTTVSGWTRDANSSFSAWNTNDIAMFALDMAAGKLWVGRNGTWLNSGDPAAGTGSVVSNISGTVFPATSPAYITYTNRLLVHADDMTYSIPSGFQAYGDGAVVQSLEPDAFTDSDTFYTQVVTVGSVTLTPTLFADGDTFYTQVLTPTYSLSPSLFTDSDTFYTQVVTVGSVTLSPSLFTDSDTFYTQVVTVGSVTLSPDLYQDSDTFYTQVVSTGSVTLSPALYQDSDTFYTHVVSVGAVTLDPTLYQDSDTFYTQVVSVGSVTLSPALFTDGDTFYTHSLALVLSPALFTDGDTFYTHVVSTGSVSLAPDLYQDADTFYTHLVVQGYSITPDYYADADTFYTHTVSVGSVTIAPDLYQDDDTFYTHVIVEGYSVTPDLYVDGDTFYTHVVSAGAVTVAPDLYQDSDIFYAHTLSPGAVTLSPNMYDDADSFYTHVIANVTVLSPTLFTDGDTFYTHTVTVGSATLSPDLYEDADTFYNQVISNFILEIQPALFENANQFYTHRVSGRVRQPAPRGATSAYGTQYPSTRPEPAKTKRPSQRSVWPTSG